MSDRIISYRVVSIREYQAVRVQVGLWAPWRSAIASESADSPVDRGGPRVRTRCFQFSTRPAAAAAAVEMVYGGYFNLTDDFRTAVMTLSVV